MSDTPIGMREYRKTATVFARKLTGTESVRVNTLEGPAVGEAGDYLCQANTPTAEQWIVRGHVFEATYEMVA